MTHDCDHSGQMMELSGDHAAPFKCMKCDSKLTVRQFSAANQKILADLEDEKMGRKLT